jgi:hypothetical protein
LSATYLPHSRFTFWGKLAAAAALVALADVLFDIHDHPGATVGALALAWTAALVVMNPAVRRDRRALLAAGAAAALAFVLIEDPGAIAVVLFGVALTLAALLPRSGPFGDARKWAGRLLFHGVTAPLRPLRDLSRLRQRVPKEMRGRIWTFAPAFILPVAGGAVFLLLFSQANPVISEALRSMRGPRLDFELIARLVFWTVVFVAVWATLRPRLPRRRKRPQTRRATALPGVSVASVTMSLVVFNALFLLQNGLDLAYLWSGAGLPEGITLAEYAHRGAYPLIATALLAGLFVLVALRPGTPTAERPMIRRLVVLWIAQNVFLVASTAHRTLDYVAAYSLTGMRIAALAWMGLVAVGLVLICWRLVRGRSGAWLINANALAALSVLALSTVLDFEAVAAAWNIRNARDTGGSGAELDICYLNTLEGSGLVALAELEQRPLSADLHERVTAIRKRNQARLEAAQADWRSWTWRGARRLARVQALTSEVDEPTPIEARDCNGGLVRHDTIGFSAPPALIVPPVTRGGSADHSAPTEADVLTHPVQP